MVVTVEGNELCLQFGYDKRAIEKIKGIGGHRWDKQRKAWFVPASAAHIVVERFPEASFSLEAWEAILVAERKAAHGLVSWLERNGVRFALDGEGELIVRDDKQRMSDVTWDLVSGYTPAIKQVLHERGQTPEQILGVEPVQVEVTHGDELVHKGIRNARKRFDPSEYKQLGFFGEASDG